MRILLVEDDVMLGDGLRFGLNQYQHTVYWVKNGLTAWSTIQIECFDLIILDLGLPKLSGDDILKKMREKNILTPVIILTAQDAIHHRIQTLDCGADDYITKPFNLEELCARIRAIHRRVTSVRVNSTITVGDITLDPATRMVFKDTKMIELSRREFELLQILLENYEKVITKEQAIQHLYGWNYAIDSNTLEVHIHNLRKKLKCKNISTIRGIGYILTEANKKSRSIWPNINIWPLSGRVATVRRTAKWRLSEEAYASS